MGSNRQNQKCEKYEELNLLASSLTHTLSICVCVCLQGPQGPTGPPGEPGEAGAPVSIKDIRIKTWLFFLELLPC